MINTLSNEQNFRNIASNIKNSILKCIMMNGSVVIPDIANITGFSTTTIAKYISEMQNEGLIIELDHVIKHAKGRRAIKYGISENSFFFIGVDVNAFGLNIAIMSFTGKIIKKEYNKNFSFSNTYDTFETVCDTIQNFINNLENISSSNITAININLSGRVNSQMGTSATLFNFEETQNNSLADILSEKLGYQVFIENDTKAMAYGDYMASFYDKYKNALYLNMSWGLGLGIIINREIYYGKDGYSGEFGHINMYDNNVMCHCGKKGCLETEISGRAMRRKISERISKGESSFLSKKVNNGITISTMDILEAINNEDPLCIEVITQTATELGKQIAALINLFNPEIIIVGGKITKAEPYYFLKPLELSIRKYSLKLMCKNLHVVTSPLGSDAGLVGACMIARARIFNEFK